MKKIPAVILGAVVLSLLGFAGALALTANINGSSSNVDLSGILNSAGTGTVNAPNSNANANGNINFSLDGNGNLIGGSGILPMNTVNSLLKVIPQVGSQPSAGSQNNATTTTTSASNNTGSASSQPSIVVYRSDVATANNSPYVVKQLPTSNGNGTIVYYYVVSNPNGVQSQENLQNYTAYTVQNDQNVQKAAVDQNGIDMTYSQPANFLGFIPSHIPVDVHVNNDGLVSADYPWYKFLTDANQADLQSAIQAKVDSALSQDSNISNSLNNTVGGNVFDTTNLPVSGSVSGGGTTTTSNNVAGNLVGGSNGAVQTNILNQVSPQTKAGILDGIHNVLQTSVLN